MTGHLSIRGVPHPGVKRTCVRCKRSDLSTGLWQRTRAAVRKRDGGCAQADGTCQGPLSVHHLRKHGAHDPSQLVTLCRRHHDLAERVCT